MKLFLLSIWIRVFPFSAKNKIRFIRRLQYQQIISDFYKTESIKQKRFYSFGAGNQRFKDKFWTYVDAPQSGYRSSGIDIEYIIDSVKPFPKSIEKAEVIFSSYLLEHLEVDAVRNYFKNAYQALNNGGVLYSVIHDFDYGFNLVKKGLIDLKTPLENRGARNRLLEALSGRMRKVEIQDGTMHMLDSRNNVFCLDYVDTFVLHHCESLFDKKNYQEGIKPVLVDMLENDASINDVYEYLNSCVTIREFHQHNADYYPKQLMIRDLENLGFREVRLVSIGQSSSPAIWNLNISHHYGFNFAIEAIK